MDLKTIAKNYVWPAVFAGVGAVLVQLQAGIDFAPKTLAMTFVMAAVAFLAAKFHPAMGKNVPWFVPAEPAILPEDPKPPV